MGASTRAWGNGPAARAVALILRPERTWAALAEAREPASETWRRQILPLAAIPPICGLAGGWLFGAGIAGIDIRLSPGALAAQAVAAYLAALAGVWLLARAIARIAPRFGGSEERPAAVRLVAYAASPLWLLGVFWLLPSLGGAAALLGMVWSLYLLRLGLPVMMRTPQGRSLTAFAVILLAVLVLAAAMRFVEFAAVSAVGGPLRVVASPRA